MSLLTFTLICWIGAFFSSTQTQTADFVSGIAARVSAESRRREEGGLSDSVTVNILSKIDESVVQEMGRAWKVVGCGAGNEEAVLLLFRMADGSIKARAEGMTNEHRSFTFNWDPAAVAIVHTHPNSADPEPSHHDRRLADKLSVPIFTLTWRGMFVYEPRTKRVFRIQRELDWIEPSKWERNRP